MSQMDKFILIFHDYENREFLRLCDAFAGKLLEERKKYPNPSRLWVLGKKLWGKAFIEREFCMRESGEVCHK